MITLVLSLYQFAALVLLALWHGQGRPAQEKSPDAKRGKAQQATDEQLHAVLPFLRFSPATKDFRCIWPYTTTYRKKCNTLVNAENDRQWANTIRNTIADDSPHMSRVEDMLREYAEFCLCWRHRPDAAKRPTIIDCWVQKWLAEIRELYDSLHDESDGDGDREGGSAPLYPQTTVLEAVSEDEGPDPSDSSARKTPLKRERSDRSTPIKTMPGSFPDDFIFSNWDRKAVAGHLSPYARRSSLPETPCPSRRYSHTIRNSPLGAQDVSSKFKRTASTTAQATSVQTEKFVPYSSPGKLTLLNVLNRPLGKDRNSGHVYIYTRRSEEDTHKLFIKIGVTQNVEDRFRQKKAECHYQPHWEYQSPLIPNAMRVESLVHTELIELRYVERQCSGCGGEHDEWFKTDVDTARPVVERWATWMQECRPYTPEGQLSPHVVKEIFGRELSKERLTSEKLVELNYDGVVAEAAGQPGPESSHLAGIMDSIEYLDSAPPRLQKSTLPARTADSPITSDEQDSLEPMRSGSPPPRQVRTGFGTQGEILHIKKTRKLATPVTDELEKAVSAFTAGLEEVKVKTEPGPDMIDPFISDVEVWDSQGVYDDAKSFSRQLLCAVEAKSELDASSTRQQPTTAGLAAGLGLPTAGECAA